MKKESKKFQEAIGKALAQYYKDAISEAVKRGLAQKKAKTCCVKNSKV